MIVKELLFNGMVFSCVNIEDIGELGIPEKVFAEALSEQNWDEIRKERDLRIRETDWTQVSDAPLPESKKSEFTAYRQTLRDIPQTYINPEDVVWPEKPTV